jgi:transcriptional antiterminator Rof (Rho-off)
MAGAFRKEINHKSLLRYSRDFLHVSTSGSTEMLHLDDIAQLLHQGHLNGQATWLREQEIDRYSEWYFEFEF